MTTGAKGSSAPVAVRVFVPVRTGRLRLWAPVVALVVLVVAVLLAAPSRPPEPAAPVSPAPAGGLVSGVDP